MEIWLDTIDPSLVQQAAHMGILHGITTNPSLLAKSTKETEELLQALLAAQKGPITVQVTAEDAPRMIEQGEALFQFSSRFFVKVPVTAEGLKAIHALSQKKIPVMATAIFSPTQVLLSARAGAQYVAPCFSTICALDASGIDDFHGMLKLLRRYQYPTKVLAASLKEVDQIRQCMEFGVDAVTLNQNVFTAFLANHEETLKQIQKFSQDWKRAKACKSLPL